MASPTDNADATAPGIPPSRAQRDAVRAAVRDYVAEHALCPPLRISELRQYASELQTALDLDDAYLDFLMVLIGNATWRPTVAAVPFERRILLLPQCLRDKNTCPAELDEFGLLCEECGRCDLGGLQSQAESLGYVVLIAEGTTVVTTLLAQGKVDAVIGAGCLDSLEKSFPHMVADAIPGIAIPLLRDGCNDTDVDLDWVRDILLSRDPDSTYRPLDIEGIKCEVRSWFEPDALRDIMAPGCSESEQIALEWLVQDGKRWRPVLLACSYAALAGPSPERLPEFVRRLAVAVECFHKASLVHDDIEDGDDTRYGKPTVHNRHGVPIALNVGDLLLGEGYRLIAECGAGPAETARMLRIAAAGHRDLCLGQGQELCWLRNPDPMPLEDVLEVFRRKTSPAFDVALRLGAIAAGTNGDFCGVLTEFSTALGIAYQIGDDLDDLHADDQTFGRTLKPSILLALAHQEASDDERRALATFQTVPSPQKWRRPATLQGEGGVEEWRGPATLQGEGGVEEWRRPATLQGEGGAEEWRGGATLQGAGECVPCMCELRKLLGKLRVEEQAEALLDSYRMAALDALQPVNHVALKSLLHRLTRRILPDD